MNNGPRTDVADLRRGPAAVDASRYFEQDGFSISVLVRAVAV